MPDIERLFDTHGLEGKAAGSPYEFVADKFMHVDREVEITLPDGKKVKQRVLDVEARTELNSPIPFASSQTYQVYLARKFNKAMPKWVQPNQDLLDIFHSRVMIAMINKDRKGRTETQAILSAYFGGQRLQSDLNTASEILKK